MYQRNIIRKWISEGENEQLDFKQNITSSHKIARNIVAFANSRGGKIVVGVADHGDIVGIDPGGEQYELEKAADNYCAPSIPLTFEEYEWQGKMLLIAHVEESNTKPHYAIDKKGRKKMYVRIADECVVPPDNVAQMLIRGDMNFLNRNRYYEKNKKDLIKHLIRYKQVSVTDYMKLKGVSERSALRTLLDFVFEGVLGMRGNNIFYLRPLPSNR